MRGIIDVELRKLAGEYIAEAWYDACECCKGFYELEDAVGQGCNEYEYRFEPKRRQYSNRINCIHIEDFVQEQLDFCLRNEEREQKLRRLQLKANRDIGTLASYTEVDKESIEELSRYAVESVRKKFKEQDLEEIWSGQRGDTPARNVGKEKLPRVGCGKNRTDLPDCMQRLTEKSYRVETGDRERKMTLSPYPILSILSNILSGFSAQLSAFEDETPI